MPRVLPRTVIYDPLLTDYAADRHQRDQRHQRHRRMRQKASMPRTPIPIIDLLAEQGIAALGRAHPGAHRLDTRHRKACVRHAAKRFTALGCAGRCSAASSISLHHKLCHTLGGSFDLPHAQTHTIVLPHALAYNAEAAPHAIAQDREWPSEHMDAARGHPSELAREPTARPIALRDIGMQERRPRPRLRSGPGESVRQSAPPGAQCDQAAAAGCVRRLRARQQLSTRPWSCFSRPVVKTPQPSRKAVAEVSQWIHRIVVQDVLQVAKPSVRLEIGLDDCEHDLVCVLDAARRRPDAHPADQGVPIHEVGEFRCSACPRKRRRTHPSMLRR